MSVTSSELERVQQSADKLREDLSVLGIHILIDRYTYDTCIIESLLYIIGTRECDSDKQF